MPGLNCFNCGLSFPTGLALAFHNADNHVLFKAYICKLCDEVNRDQESARKHALLQHLNVQPEDLEVRPKVKASKAVSAEFNDSKDSQALPAEAAQLLDPKCSACRGGFPDLAALGTHLESHRKRQRTSKDQGQAGKNPKRKAKMEKACDDLPFSCSKCPRSFALNMQLKKHTCSGSDSNNNRTIKTEPGLKTASKAAAPVADMGTMYPCGECEEEFHFELVRHHHIQVVHRGRGRDRCHVSGCESTFQGYPHRVLRHLIRVHMRDQFEFLAGRTDCGECGARLSRDDELALHMACKHPFVVKAHIASMKTEEAPYPCSACPESFYYEEFLLQHMALRHGGGASDEAKRCIFCPERTFADEATIYAHLVRFHMKSEVAALVKATAKGKARAKAKECAFCQAKQISKAEVAKHMLIRHKKKTYKLLKKIGAVIDKAAADSNQVESETGPQLRLNLEPEPELETEPEPEPELEPEPQLDPSPLLIPKLEPNPEPVAKIDPFAPCEFACPEPNCPYSFHYEPMLIHHRAVRHDGLSPNQCHMCDSKFDKQSRVFRHLTSIHLGQVMRAIPAAGACPVCAKDFSNTASMRLHLIREHAYYVKQTVGNGPLGLVSNAAVDTEEATDSLESGASPQDERQDKQKIANGNQAGANAILGI